MWPFFRNHTNLFDGKPKRLLHVSPEHCLKDKIARAVGEGYVSTDYDGERADERVDITDAPYPDASFDAIYCSHVLEHIEDDRKAMRELRRILKPNGWAVLMVPITVPRTYEDPSVTDPDERRRVFGQFDHVRRYGPDFADRLTEAGFLVEALGPRDLYSEDQRVRLGVEGDERKIHLCTAPA